MKILAAIICLTFFAGCSLPRFESTSQGILVSLVKAEVPFCSGISFTLQTANSGTATLSVNGIEKYQQLEPHLGKKVTVKVLTERGMGCDFETITVTKEKL